jgi:predicted dehydrogenase
MVKNSSRINRRDFLRTGSLGALGLLAGSALEIPAQAQTAQPAPAGRKSSEGPSVNLAIIGVGPWGRELISTLATVPGARVHTVCENYPPFLRRATNAAPEAKAVAEYRQVLDDPEVQAVIVATPSHQHRDIAIAALEAGKHVYCEAPLAASIDDARAIAQAAAAASKQIFQVGQQLRANPQHHHVLNFFRTGAIGDPVMARGQWHKKQSWRRSSPSREREAEVNWRLSAKTSPGLMGEIGIHHVDVASWFLNARPVAVTGFGGIRHWKDGRDVPDTVQAVFEYPNGITFAYSCSLANSYDSNYDVFYGSDSAILLRDNRAWMFREPDAPLLGWEVYARKEEFFQQTGISLVADATQLLAQGVDPASGATAGETAVFSALEHFMECIQEGKTPSAGARQGLEATVTALKANEAIVSGRKITFEESWFDV